MQETHIFDSAATIIDLEERSSFDPYNPSAAASHSPQTYYAIDVSSDEHRSKKRKVERACDFCRRRKTKCDGPKMRDNVCTNCVQTGRHCTYIESSKPRGPPKAYITALEDRVEKMEALLKRLRPEADFTPELGPPVVRDSWRGDPSSSRSAAQALTVASASASTAPSSSRGHILLPLATAIPLPGSAYRGHGSSAFGSTGTGTPYMRHRRPRRHKTPSRAAASAESSNQNSESSATSSLSGSDIEDSAVELSLVQGMTHLTVRGLRPAHVPSKHATDGQWRFHGKSSSFKLIHAARELKQRHMDEVVGGSSPDSPEAASSCTPRPPPFAPRRPEYWNSLPWEISFEGADRSTTTPSFVMTHFPPLDLAESLIDLYFTRNNSLFPLLHRPTFDRQWKEGLYKTDMWYACVCMAMFAVASRWSDDPRVLPLDVGEDISQEGHGVWALAGRKFVDVAMEAHRRRRSLFLPANLFEVQTLVLMGMYFRGTVAHAESWTLISIGIRKAQDVGAHRRMVYGRKPTVEEELWKRSIWHLIAIDRLGSMLIGRPCCSRDEDFDLELPLEVDDEYWENENEDIAFQQPHDKPALVSAFVYWVKLSHISAFALRTLYAIGRSKQPLGLVGPRWREQTVAKLNEAMLEWINSLPEHLRWTPTMADDIFASQSAMLHLSYYMLQITIYRPFIPVPLVPSSRSDASDKSDLSLSALSVCANAAKAGTLILEVLLQRGYPRHTVLVHYAFLYAGVLLVNKWTQIAKEAAQPLVRTDETQHGKASATNEQMDELMKLVSMLNSMKPRWELAREACDSIIESLPAYSNSDSDEFPIRNSINAVESRDGASTSRSSATGSVNPAPRLYYPSSGPAFHMRDDSTYPLDSSTQSFPPEASFSYAHPVSQYPENMPYDALSRLGPVQDIRGSAHGVNFALSEVYPIQDDWSSVMPHSSLYQRSTVGPNSISASRPDQAYRQQPSYAETVSSGRALSTPFGLANVAPNARLPYIKHELSEDGQVQLSQEIATYAPSHHQERRPTFRNIHRPLGDPLVQEEIEHPTPSGCQRRPWHGPYVSLA